MAVGSDCFAVTSQSYRSPDGSFYGSVSEYRLCLWSISVPPGYSLLLEFEHFDLENDSYCRYDRLTVSVGTHRPVGIFCGSVLRIPVLLIPSENATLLFSSDISRAGSGFVMRHRAVQGHSDPGCGTVVVVEDQTVVHSPNYPQSYSNDCILRWVIYAPRGHVVKLEFADIELEESDRCLYDSLTVLGDVEQTEEIAVLCGSSVPPPVLSYRSVMVLQFVSDSSITHRGFRAALTFISRADLHHNEDRPGVEGQGGAWRRHQDELTADQQRKASNVNMDLADPDVQQSTSRALSYQGDMDQRTPEDPRLHMDMGSDDEDYSGESSGTE
ncbi:ovochymase-2 isoform X2 [Trachinotus anak]|uniref:ovochymase-2 isoform X2 n=1 Tax=Trachinotus anak TaxID=443729 RepID=UPI0039F20922